MSVVHSSTAEEPAGSTSQSSPKPGGGFMAGGVWMPRLGKNDLASTAREWAIKPPPGMESDPLRWDEITKL
jgi:hypothetical protein